MAQPARLEQQAHRWALVDGIPFELPVYCRNSPALFAVFSIDADKARKLIPGNEIYPIRLWNRGMLVVSVIDYLETNIGRYIEFSIAIACTHGSRPAPRLLPGLFMSHYGTGQWVFDLPVSSEVSVKGGKGIWGMPKHQANLDYAIGEDVVSSRYDQDGMFAMKIEVQRPKSCWVPVRMRGVNYSAFRGMLFKSAVFFSGKLGFHLFKRGSAKLIIGDHPRVQPLKELDISPDPILAAFLPQANGVLDDHTESWFLSENSLPATPPEGMEAVVNLGQSQEWLAPPVSVKDTHIARELVRP
jgi:Acetoacetate decarboxylase (ADC)